MCASFEIIYTVHNTRVSCIYFLTCVAEQYSRVVGQACLALSQLVQIATACREKHVKHKFVNMAREQKTHAGIM